MRHSSSVIVQVDDSDSDSDSIGEEEQKEDLSDPDPLQGMEDHKAMFKEEDVSKILILAYPR